jgi:hypothetical protein
VVLVDDLSWPSPFDTDTAVEDGRAQAAGDGAGGVVRGSIAVCPNPANGQVTLVCELDQPAAVDLSVYGLNGQRLRRLCRWWWPRGTRRIGWDGCDERGLRVASGVYLCRLLTATGSVTARLALVQ